MEDGRGLGQGEAEVGGETVRLPLCLGWLERPGRVVDFADEQAAGPAGEGEEAVALGKEAAEVSGLAGRDGAGGAVAQAGFGGAGAREQAAAGVGDAAVGVGAVGHAGGEVGQREDHAGAEDGERGGGVERVEPDAALAGAAGADVGAEVELGEGARGGEGEGALAEGADADLVHIEGHDAEPGVAVVGVDLEAGREAGGDGGGRDGPVGEEEVVPALAHAPLAVGERVGAVRGLEEGVGHISLDAAALWNEQVSPAMCGDEISVLFSALPRGRLLGLALRMPFAEALPITDTPKLDPTASVPAPVSPTVPSTEVYAIHGADPEVLAYAMAKYSRSALTMKESLAEISAQRAEQFLNTFYFQYGHRSIADLAHIPFAIERLSLLAAIDLVDEQRWDGQERSTRYQDFAKSGWATPDFGEATPAFTAAVERLFTAYAQVGTGMLEALRRAIPRPEGMKPEAYERTLRARAFDVARYLLPLATNTSLGQIVNARTLETQVSRLLSSGYAEIRGLGEQLRAAAAGPAWNVQEVSAAGLLAELEASGDVHARAAAELLRRPVATAPTLVKYAASNAYQTGSRAVLGQAAAELMANAAIAPAPVVDLVEDGDSLEVELATALLYPVCHYPYRQIREAVAALPAARRGRADCAWGGGARAA